MLKQTILWTTLPNGISNGQLRLSVFVSPRLQTSAGKAPLTEFQDFMDWPAVVQPMSFSVQFENGPTIQQVTRVSPDPESELWQALFSNTFVESYEFDDYSNRFIHSYPVKNVLSVLKQVYQTTAIQSPTERPKIKDLVKSDRLGQVANLERYLEWNDWINTLKYQFDEGAVPPDKIDPPRDFRQLKWFHRPPGAKNLKTETVQTLQTMVKDPQQPGKPAELKTVSLDAKYATSVKVALPDPDAFANMIDFHQIVSSMGEYPQLMRRLGLVVDLEVALQDDIPAASKVWVNPNWAPAITNGAVPPPKTAYSIAAGEDQFIARSKTPNNPEIADGMLKLNDPGTYDLVQVDVDGIALKAMNFADNMARMQDANAPVTSIDSPEEAGLPSLRSTGLAIVRSGRAHRQALKFKAAKDTNNAITNQQDATLYAEELVRGYRIDVWDSKSAKWHSLCRRKGTYDIGSNIQLKIEDEGNVSLAMTSAADGSSDDFYMHESMMHWDGWSLCAPRPGGLIDPDDKVQMPMDNGEHPGQFKNKKVPGLPMDTTFSVVPGSLPRLRFGLKYRLRARAVDIAGNGLKFDEPKPTDFSNAISATNSQQNELPYLRFEPVSSPTVVLKQEPGEGESLERLAIRSYNDAPNKDSQPSSETAEVHIAPPKTSQLTAEMYGMFDDPNSHAMKKDLTTYNMIAQKDKGSFEDPNLPKGKYTVHPGNKLNLPYLPDPQARGATFRGLPGETVKVRRIDFGSGNNWPDAKPFRIQVIEGKGSPNWNASARVLRVKLEKAEIATVRYGSYFDNDDLELMGVWQWIVEKNPANIDSLMNMILNGLHWMLTPFRELELVHAVQQPLLLPEIQKLRAKKFLGNTYATLDGVIRVHGKSTDKIDLIAEWQEPVDNPDDENNNPAEDKLDGRARAFDAPVNLSEEPTDTAGGSVHYREAKKQMLLGRGDPETGQLDYIGPRHEFGDTKYRRVRYHAVATTRFREYFSSDITDDLTKITREGEAFGEVDAKLGKGIDILNSARPAAPKVLYVIPTFGWDKIEMVTGEIVSKRSGGGLRVYLERPWFSSGDGELLGVVLWQRPRSRGLKRQLGVQLKTRQPYVTFTSPPDTLKPYVTQWGMDPIWGSSPTPTHAAPSLAQVKTASKTESGLSLDELPFPGYQVVVAGHEVYYDSERQLWYCDIEIDPGKSYYPFVRLALARYQPKSVADAHLSRVVLADFAQLTPERSLSVTYKDATTLNVAVTGMTYSQAPLKKDGKPEAASSEIQVSLERRRTGVEDQDLGWIPSKRITLKQKQTVLRRKGQKGPSVTIWQGKIELPSTSGSQKFRLVVKEYERFIADAEPPKNSPLPPSKKLVKKQWRLVYADAVEL